MWRLEVTDWVDPTRWRWRLSDAAAVVAVEHAIELDAGVWQFEAFTDLYRYLQWNVAPDRRREQEAALLVEVGDWIGGSVLGPVGAEIGTRRGTVRLELPAEAAVLGYRPWELARIDDRDGRRSWAASRVRVVVVPQPHRPLAKNDVGERLRMLAVFSLPDGENALNLRRERFELARLVHGVARVHGKAVELRVVQYGATRGRLTDALLEEAGWDVVHLSGHGLAGGLVLEDDAGRPDRITSDELVDLLALGDEQIKLVTLSSCESAAVTAGEHLRLLGLGLGPERDGVRADGGRGRGAAHGGRPGPIGDRPEGDADGSPAGEVPAGVPAHEDHADVAATDGAWVRGDRRTDGAAVGTPDPEVDGGEQLTAVAAAVVERLDCAVLAMRYPVADDFAIDLAGSFYELLLGKGQSVAGAVASSLVRPDRGGAATGLALGTPALFGSRAADLTLAPPAGAPQVVGPRAGRLAEFLPQPVRFVGRVAALTRASKALAPDSGRPGVVLHGMAGAGKTACALELAYTHEASFPDFMAWFAAPEDGAEIRPALASFALTLERQVPGLRWVHLVDDPEKLRAYLPTLTQVFEDNRILVVLDNVESLLNPAAARRDDMLLTDPDQWRDDRWGWVLAALLGHAGLSRVVVTTRQRIVGLPEPVLAEAVHALSLDESVLLARELPRLRGLLDGFDLPAGLTPPAAHDLVRRVIEVVQGHPKLLELADGAAADPRELAARLDEADRAWLARGTRLDGFLRGADASASDEDFGAVLAGWTWSAAAGLPDDAEFLLRLVCGLEDADREPFVLEAVWPEVWQRAGRSGPVGDLDAVMAVLVERALVAAERDPESGVVVAWRVHAGVADAVRADTAPEVIDEVAGDAWLGTLEAARGREAAEQVGAWVVRAARSAAPYLLRRGRWADLDRVAEEVRFRDPGVGAAAWLVPMLAVAVAATRGGDLAPALGRTHALAVVRVDPARGKALLTGLLDAAVAAGRFDDASVLAGDLANRLRDEGHLDAALALVERKVEYSRRAGFGPWTQLHGRGQRLQVQLLQGRVAEVLAGVEELRAQMATLPPVPDRAIERVAVWQVGEFILNTGVLAAQDLGRWERSLALNAEVLASLDGRGASAHEWAIAAFNDYFPLVRLGRLGETRDVLLSCRDAFAAADDVLHLGKTLSALADLEDTAGHPDRAVDLERDALRLTYTAGEPDSIGVSHHNLANYLRRGGADPSRVAAHRVAAAVIDHQTGSGGLASSLAALGRLLATPDGRRVPRLFDQVCALVGEVPGVDLAGLVARLPRRAPDGDAAVVAVLAAAPAAAADAAAAEQAGRVERALELWQPVVSALHAAVADPDSTATAVLADVVDSAADSDDWHNLVPVLRRIHAGERDPDALLAGLDDIDTAVARRALDVLAGTTPVAPDAWRALLLDDHPQESEPAG